MWTSLNLLYFNLVIKSLIELYVEFFAEWLIEKINRFYTNYKIKNFEITVYYYTVFMHEIKKNRSSKFYKFRNVLFIKKRLASLKLILILIFMLLI